MVAGYARVTGDSRVTRGTAVTFRRRRVAAASAPKSSLTTGIRTGSDVVASVPVRMRSYPPPCEARTTIDLGGFSPTEGEVLVFRGAARLGLFLTRTLPCL